MTNYTIQFRSFRFGLKFDGEKFREGSFDTEKFETIAEAREAIDHQNTPDCIAGSEFVILKETYDEETDEYEEVEVETILAGVDGDRPHCVE